MIRTAGRVFDFFWGPADPRAYALVRIALALGGLVNLAELWGVRFEFYASSGMIPFAAVLETMNGLPYFTVFDSIGSDRGTTAVFVAGALALVALGLGVYPRFSAVCVFLWHLSASHRAPPILHGWDHILRAYSFLVLVSPMPRVWCVRWGARAREAANALTESVPVYGLRLMQWQLVVIYLTTVWLKLPDAYWRNGSLLAYFSVSLFSRTPQNLFLVRHEWVSALGSYVSLAIETSVPFLLASRKTRWFGLFSGFSLHFLVALTAKIAVFSTCMIIPYIAFLEEPEIDWFVALAKSRSLADVRTLFRNGRLSTGQVKADHAG
jgi:hypothetical protein